MPISPLKTVLGLAAATVAALAVAVAVNTWRSPSRQLAVQPAPALAIDADAAARRLGGALGFRTISLHGQPDANAEAFAQFQDYLAQQFPRVHASLQRELVGRSLLFTWRGQDPKAEPIMWLAHQDVVPVAPGTEADWQQAPFAGVVKDGFVWGRGAWDDKGNLLAQLEAIETLLAQGFTPRRTVYLGYGADEEVGGVHGASAIVALLQQRQIKLGYVLDEGMLVTEGMLPGLAQPAALIGVAEKGYASVVLELRVPPGHSSTPPAATGIGQMSAAVAALEREGFPAQASGVAREMFETLAPEMTGVNRVALSNLWLFGPLLTRELAKAPATAAMLHTTTAPTIFQAGDKDNVLPGKITATVNFRMLPGTSIADVVEHVKAVIKNEAISVRVMDGKAEPSRVTPTSTPAYTALNRTVREVFSGAVVAPALMLGATDSRLYAGLTENIFKFSPVRAGPADVPRFHGTNERLAVSNYTEMIRFYHRLLQNTAQ
ncbi:M20 family peptidase [Massilia sp. TS11]|uniref:M20 family peptidase n=1 Tax=Massilia sp. TS11 TaxID=2908003 RepID=UPI001EDAA329|nr:M20 family peptidase [Massilia sp. TS11]MCG2583608.1 M20 family peptidase [Massilia sp. TS11]